MADNISTKVLTVDTGNAITNVKDFKARIEELKGALLGLEKGTEEYNAVAKELRNSQEKLTEVMDVARGKAEGVDGSYDNLVATMRQLKQEWRATTDEAERASLGSQILEINNQLKELDASTGNFQRNVGDYANAFESAMRAVIGGVGRFNPELSKMAATVGSLIPVIKQASATATAGLTGIKKAIVSTGIGALVVAVGLLAANWEKVKEVIGGMIGKQKSLTSEINNSVYSAENLKKRYDDMNSSLEFTLRLMQAQGATNAEVLKFQEGELIKQYGDALSQLSRLENQYANRKNAWDFTEKENKALQDKITAQKEIVSNLGNQLEVNRQNQKIEQARAETAERERQKAEEERKKNGGSSAGKSDAEKEAEDDLKRIDAINKAIEDANKSELEKLEETYNEQKALFERHGADTTALTEKFHQDYMAIMEKNKKERMDQMSADAAAAAAEREFLVSSTEKTIEEIKKAAKDSTVALELQYELKGLETDGMSNLEQFFGKDMLFNLDNITGVIDREIEVTNKIYEINRTALVNEITELQNLMANLAPETDEYLSTQTRITEASMELDNLQTENTINNLNLMDDREEALSEARQKRMASFSDMLSSVGALVGNLSSVMEEQINTEVENGRMSEKTAKSRFESVKKMQIGAAIINMAAGVVSAIAQAQQLGPIMGPIMAAINSAAIIAAGAVQISQIKRQQFGSSSSSNSVSTPNLSTVSTVQQAPTLVANPTGDTELSELTNAVMQRPVVVQVSDIDDVNRIKDATMVETVF